MSARGDHETAREDLAAYALGALAGDERAAVEAHLGRCERCRTELEWLRPAAEVLAISVPQQAPPRRLRRRTLAAARGEARADRPSSIRGARPRIAVAAAGLAAAALGVAVAVGVLGDDPGVETRTVPVEVAAAPAAGASGELVITGDNATLEVAGLPELDRDSVYQAWLERDGELEPSSTFIVDRSGTGAAAIAEVAGATRVMVTREPRGGSEVPSSAPLLAASPR